jgi:hypothetical protein
MTDPYQQHPNPYGQQPGGYAPDPPGGPRSSYGHGQPNPYGAQPSPRGQRPDRNTPPDSYTQQPDRYAAPDPYSEHGRYAPQEPYRQQPDRYAAQEPHRQQDRYAAPESYRQQPDRYGQDPYPPQSPYGGEYGPGQPHQHGQQHDPYQTRPYEPSQFGSGGPGDQYGRYQGSYGPPPGWGQGGGPPPGQPRRSRLPIVLFSVLAVLVIGAGAITAVLLVDGDGSTPAAQITTAPPIQPETISPTAPTTTRPPATSSSKTFEAGQCATLTPEPGNRAKLNETLCGDSNSDVIVALVHDGECAKDYITFNADVGKVYCLALDAEEGACFQFDQLAKRAPNCTAGTHKVAKIFEDVTDGTRCDQVQGVDRRFAYPQPARTICLVPA